MWYDEIGWLNFCEDAEDDNAEAEEAGRGYREKAGTR
jgi:hypothetical protein